MSDTETYRVTIELAAGPVTISVGKDEFILTAAREAGLELPSLCEQGWCLTCAAWLLSGHVDQTASRRFFEADRAAGFALPCTGRPRSDLRLRPGATAAMRANRDAHGLAAPRGTGL